MALGVAFSETTENNRKSNSGCSTPDTDRRPLLFLCLFRPGNDQGGRGR
jgi:hypothetical protein